MLKVLKVLELKAFKVHKSKGALQGYGIVAGVLIVRTSVSSNYAIRKVLPLSLLCLKPSSMAL